jgi:hypothetical protein
MAICKGCKSDTELRLGFCFDCASRGEQRAAQRTVLQHVAKALHNARINRWNYVRYDLTWAWQRLTHTGDYAKRGYFSEMGVETKSPTRGASQ